MKSQKKRLVCWLLIVLFITYLSILPIGLTDTDLISSLEISYTTGYPYDSNLILYLPLLEKEGSTAFDVSGFNNHGLLKQTGEVSWENEGGLSFNGENDNIIINSSKSLNSVNMTLFMQFVWDGKVTDTEMYLYDDGWAENGAVIIFIQPEFSRLYLQFKTKSGKNAVLWHEINPNELYSFFFSFDGQNYSFWLNHSLKSGSFEEKEELLSERKILVGSNYHGTRRWFSGAIYCIQIFNCGIPDARLAYFYNLTTGKFRFNPETKYVIGGLVSSKDPALILNMKEVQLYLNSSYITTPDSSGVYLFIIDLPTEYGNHTYQVSINNEDEGFTKKISAIVDQIVVSEAGSINATVGQEATIWLRLRSAFDSQLMKSGIVTLSGGLNAKWNENNSRWEFKTIRYEETSISLSIESVFWDQFEINSLYPNTGKEVFTIQWSEEPWTAIFVRWLLGVSPSVWAAVLVVIILLLLVKFKVLKLEVSKPLDPNEKLKRQLDQLLEPLAKRENEYATISKFLHNLLEDNPSQELIETLQDRLPSIIDKFSKND